MAKFSVDGLDGLMDDLSALDSLPDSIIGDMLDAEADVIVQAQRSEIQKQWSGPYSEGISAKSIKKGKVKKTKSGHAVDVYPQGTRKRGKQKVQNTEIAFINEFGSSGAGRKRSHKKRTEPKRVPPRPAIRTANAKAEDTAVDAGTTVLHNFLDKHKL